MPIRFKCPHCKKGLVVKEQMAGKKAACPACKKVLSVPATVSAPADLEAFAAAALADQPVTPPPQTDGKSDGKADGKTNGRTDGAAPPSAPAPAIEFNCEFCDTRLKFDADMGGKKAPCTNPECRRIIKVPMPKIERPKDWREVSKGPSAVLAKKPEQLEGAWGTATDKSKVSQAALAEADAIIEVDEDDSSPAMRWLRRGLWIGGVGGALFLTIWGLSRRHEVTTQREAIDLALDALETKDHKDAKKILAAWTAVVFRGAGEYHVTKKKAATAQQYFTKARAMLPADPVVDADLFRKVLAASEVTLGGSDEQARDGERLPWADAFTYIKRPIGDIKSSEARVLAAREVGTLLLRKDQGNHAFSLAGDTPQHKPLECAHKKSADPLGKMPDPAKTSPELHKRLECAEAFARLGDFERAGRFVDAKGKDNDRFQAALGVAAVALADGKINEAFGFLRKAVELSTENLKGKVSPWHLLEMVRMMARLDSAGAASELMKKQKLPANFQGWAQLEIYLAELARAKDRVDPAAVEEIGAKESLPRALAWEAWARHNTRVGYRDEVRKAAEGQENPAIRAVLYIGIALGSQDRER